MYKLFIRPILFKFNPEKTHHFSFSFLKWVHKIPLIPYILRKMYVVEHPKLEKKILGLHFSNPVGLAAGFDKDAQLYNELADLGFGFIEIGTLTPKAQKGNALPRLFRLPKDQGIINRMGFNNQGVDQAIKQLKKNKKKIIIGGNIGKNTNSSVDEYIADYVTCFKALHSYVDYFVLNVSCPNVESHAKLEDKDFLSELILEVKKHNHPIKPILLKIAPDLNRNQLDEIIELIHQTKIDGVIATNTSVSRQGLKISDKKIKKIGAGGLSGQPIKDKSTETIRYLARHKDNSFVIIGVGGVHSPQDAIEKLDAGADLIQLYSGLIYEGPALVRKINRALLSRN